jgi:hypothetical protein
MKMKFILNIFEGKPYREKTIKHEGLSMKEYFNRYMKKSYHVEMADCIPMIDGRIADWSAVPPGDSEIEIVRAPIFRFGD